MAPEMTLYEALKALARKAYDHGHGFTDSPELPDDWHADAAAKLTRLGLYADRRVAAAASVAYGAAWSWGQNTKYDDPDDPKSYERLQRYDDAEFELLVLIREALSIPEADLTLPPPGYTWDAPRSDASDSEETGPDSGQRPDQVPQSKSAADILTLNPATALRTPRSRHAPGHGQRPRNWVG